jgi:DNA-directed RNA polymerase sigma subunit (sigma70/sigma32)
MQTTTLTRPALRPVPVPEAPRELDSLAAFLFEAARQPRLSKADELELGKLIERGDEAARRQLIASNLRLVASLAQDFRHHGASLLDVIHEGMSGLACAAERFDWRLGNGFSTYAGWWIQTAIRRGSGGDTVCKEAA